MGIASSALATIPPSYIETADVVGASAWQKIRDILAPLMRGHILTDLILITLWTFNVFTPYLLTGGGPTFKTQLVSKKIINNIRTVAGRNLVRITNTNRG